MTTALPEDLKQTGHYSMTETAKILEIDQSTLWRWRRDGTIRVSGYNRTNNRPYFNGKEITRAFNGI